MKNSQKGFVVPVLIIIIALLVVAGGMYFYSQRRSEVPQNKNVVTKQGFAHPETCNPGSIEKQSVSIQDACYQQIAMETKNPEICAKIQSRGGIWSNCYDSIAISTNNPNVCKKIIDTANTAYRSACYDIYASSLNKPEVCAQITSGQDFAWYKDTCYRNAANKSKNTSICNDIVDPSIKLNCQQGI